MKNFKNRFFLPARICGNRKGFALLIVMGFCLIIGIMSIGMITQTIRTVKNTGNDIRSSQVYYAAQGGIELAKLQLRRLKEDPTLPTIGTKEIVMDNGEKIKIDWKIKVSTNKGEGDYFYVPNPGEGSASGNCKSYEAAHKGMDHPCSWNKIYVGETVNIPLWFYGKDTGSLYAADGIIDPVEEFEGKKLENFYLRMRTPCVNGGEEPGCVRYMFYKQYGAPSDSNENKTLINWEINGEKLLDESQTYTLQANLAREGNRYYSYNNCDYSEIFQELIDIANEASPSYCDSSLKNVKVDSITVKNIVLSTFHSGHLTKDLSQKVLLNNYFLNLSPLNSNSLHKPVLKLQVIDELRLQEDQKDTPLLKDQAIPYLEYQVMTNRPIGNARRIIEATATLGNTQEKIVWDEAQEGAMGGFAVQN